LVKSFSTHSLPPYCSFIQFSIINPKSDTRNSAGCTNNDNSNGNDGDNSDGDNSDGDDDNSDDDNSDDDNSDDDNSDDDNSNDDSNDIGEETSRRRGRDGDLVGRRL